MMQPAQPETISDHAAAKPTVWPLPLLVVHSNTILLRIIVHFLTERHPDVIRVVGAATSVEQALELAASRAPGAALIGIDTASLDGLHAITCLKAQHPALVTIALVSATAEAYAHAAAAAGASATITIEWLKNDMRTLIAGHLSPP